MDVEYSRPELFEDTFHLETPLKMNSRKKKSY